jgi:hypothetical protein
MLQINFQVRTPAVVLLCRFKTSNSVSYVTRLLGTLIGLAVGLLAWYAGEPWACFYSREIQQSFSRERQR